MFLFNDINLIESFIGFLVLFMLHLFIFITSVVKLGDQLLPLVEENLARTRKGFLLGRDRRYDFNHFATFGPVIQCSNHFLHQYETINFVFLHFCRLEIFGKNCYFSNEEKQENFH